MKMSERNELILLNLAPDEHQGYHAYRVFPALLLDVDVNGIATILPFQTAGLIKIHLDQADIRPFDAEEFKQNLIEFHTFLKESTDLLSQTFKAPGSIDPDDSEESLLDRGFNIMELEDRITDG
jgi:hypothetical protein